MQIDLTNSIQRTKENRLSKLGVSGLVDDGRHRRVAGIRTPHEGRGERKYIRWRAPGFTSRIYTISSRCNYQKRETFGGKDESVLEDKMLKACWHVCWWPMHAIAKMCPPVMDDIMVVPPAVPLGNVQHMSAGGFTITNTDPRPKLMMWGESRPRLWNCLDQVAGCIRTRNEMVPQLM